MDRLREFPKQVITDRKLWIAGTGFLTLFLVFGLFLFTTQPSGEITQPPPAIDSVGPLKSNLIIKINARGFQPSFVTSTPSTNPLLSALLSGKAQSSDFVAKSAGDLSINDYFVANLFQGSSPEIKIEETTATITFTVNSTFPWIIRPFGETEINIKRRVSLTDESELDLHAIIEDYTVLSVDPNPSLLSGNAYTWGKIGPEQEIHLRLGRDLSAQISSLPRINIFDFATKSLALIWIILFLIDVFSAVLFSGLLWIEENTSIAISGPVNLVQRIRSILKNSGAIFLLPTLLILVSELTYLIKYPSARSPLNFVFLKNIFETIQYSFFNIFANADTFTLGVLNISLLLVLLFVTAFLSWLLRNKSIVVRGIIQFITRAILFTLLIYGSGLILIYVLKASQPRLLFYASWVIESIILTILGIGLAINILRVIHRYRENESAPPIQNAATLLAAFLIPLFATGASYKAITGQPFFDFIGHFVQGFQNMISVLGNAAIYYSIFAAMMIGTLLGQEHSWGKGTEEGVTGPEKKANHHQEMLWKFLGLIMFAGYIVGLGNTILSIPVSAIIAALIFQYLLLSKESLAQLASFSGRIVGSRQELLRQLADDLSLNRQRARLDQLVVSLSSGKVTPTEYDSSVEIIKKEIAHIEDERPIKDIPANEFVLAIGPENAPVDNAFLGLKWSFLLQIPLLLLLFNGNVLNRDEYPWLYLAISEFIFIMKWSVIGFFFGLFYEHIKGHNGIRKALTITLGIMIAVVPYQLIKGTTSLSNIQALILNIGITTLFLLLLGILFDRETLKRHGFRFSYLRVVTSDFTSVAYISSLLIPVILVIIPTVITGQLGQILTILVKDVLPALISPPTH